LLAWEAADHLYPPAGLPEGPLDQVGVPDAFVVLFREPQVGDQGVQVALDAGDGRGVERLPFGDEALGSFPAFGLGGSAVGVDAIEDGPVVALYLVLGLSRDLPGQVPADMDVMLISS